MNDKKYIKTDHMSVFFSLCAALLLISITADFVIIKGMKERRAEKDRIIAESIEAEATQNTYTEAQYTYSEDASNEETVSTEQYAIKSLDDIPSNVLENAIQYTTDDLEAKLAEDTSVSPSGYIVGAALHNKYTDSDSYYFCYKYDSYEYTRPECLMVTLCIPKNGSKQGKLILSYEFDNIFVFGDEKPELGTVNETIYVPYTYEINLENPELPIEDYNSYSYLNSSNGDWNFENYHNKNIISLKDEYEIEELRLK